MPPDCIPQLPQLMEETVHAAGMLNGKVDICLRDHPVGHRRFPSRIGLPDPFPFVVFQRFQPMPQAYPVCHGLDMFFPVPFLVTVFISGNPADGIEDDMPMYMLCIIMYGKYIIVSVPQVFPAEILDCPIRRLLIRLPLCKGNDEMVALASLHLPELLLGLQESYQGLHRVRAAVAPGQQAVLRLFWVEDVVQRVLQVRMPGRAAFF